MIANIPFHSAQKSFDSRKSTAARWMIGLALWIGANVFAMAFFFFDPVPPVAYAAVTSAPATTITVDRTDDNAGASACTGGANDCSLRGAIIFANANPGTVIGIPSGTYILTISSAGSYENAAASGDLDINANVTINGAGSSSTIISTTYTSACGDCKVFGINQDGTHNNLVVTISGVTISGGYNNGASFCGTFFETGGGVDLFLTGGGAGASLTLSDVVIKNNKTTGCSASYGGGINIDTDTGNSGVVAMTNVTITNNTADATGGGINFFGDLPSLTINATSLISGNTTFGPSGLGANGGGINIRTTTGGSVAIHGTTIANNTGKGYGGGVDIAAANKANVTINDTGGASSITGNTVQNNATISGNGGGLSKDDGSTTATLTNVIISNNHANNQGTTGSSPQGGGIFITGGGGSLTMTGGSLTNNTANDVTNNKGDGGGAALTQSAGTVNLTNVVISGNTARQNGGGMYVANGGTVTLGGTTELATNTATMGNGGALNASGGTVNLNPSGVFTITNNSAINGGGVAILGATTNITYANILTNTGSTQGGGLYMGSGLLKMNFSRIKANTSAGATGLRVNGGTVSDITNNWWACNGDPSLSAAGCDLVTGTSAVNPRLYLHHTASPSTILLGGSTTLTADFLTNSSSSPIAVANLRTLIGLPISFNNAIKGTLSGSQTSIQASGSATSTFTSTACNTGSADGVVDSATSAASITIQCPDFRVNKSNNVGSNLLLGNSFTWTLTISNTGAMTGTFANAQTILSDTLPTTNITYGTPLIANINNVTNSGNISCGIASNNLSCAASGAPVVFGPTNGRFDVSFSAAPMVAGLYSNPRAGGNCTVDPNSVVIEANEANNSCENIVSVTVADVQVSKSGPASVASGATLTYTLSAQNNGTAAASNVKVIDALPGCLTNVLSSPSGLLDAGNILTITLGSLGVSASVPVTITATAPFSCVPSVRNSATITTTTPESNSANNTSSTITTTVVAPNRLFLPLIIR